MSESTFARAPHGAVIFCRVIDNFGDAGVTWRLAKRLTALGYPTTLVIDAVDVLARLVPELDPAATRAEVRGITVLDWERFARETENGNLEAIGGTWPSLVMETFGCRLPDAVEEGLADDRRRLYMNLEYLSAEAWVEGSHNIWGLHPRLPIKKLWYFPGFTDKTGGVLIEDDLAARQAAFDKTAFLREHGADLNRRTLYFFAYPSNALEALAASLDAVPEALNLILAPGEASAKLTSLLADSKHLLIQAPFVSQEAFDHYLWAADAVIIRGEDSFVRAQLAGVPMLWSTYPIKENNGHYIKLDAWLARYTPYFADTVAGAAARETFDAMARGWVHGTLEKAAMTQWLAALPEHRTAARAWRESLFKRGCLARHIDETVHAVAD